jgi:hypothetical protein
MARLKLKAESQLDIQSARVGLYHCLLLLCSRTTSMLSMASHQPAGDSNSYADVQL